MGIIVLIAFHIGIAPGVADQCGRNADRAARVEDVEHGPLIRHIDAQRGVDLRRRRAADQQRHRHPRALHFLGDRHHFVERRGDQAAEADHVGVILVRRLEDLRPGDHHAEVDDLEPVTLQHHADDILADVVDVALHGRHHDLALALRTRLLGCLDKGQQMRDRLFHHARRFHHLRQEHLA